MLLTLVCSIVPLLAVGWVLFYYYSSFARDRVETSMRARLGQHRELVALFLREQSSKLQLIAGVESRESLVRPGNLSQVHASLNEDLNIFTDLGVIDGEGRHLAYSGPYDLLSKNYSQTFWFKDIIDAKDQAVYVSDMFLGYRNVPHFIIAVLRREGGSRWILRATIDTNFFRGIVEDLDIGKTGDAFILNERGAYQTNPRHYGKIMEQSSFPVMPFDEGAVVGVRRFEHLGGTVGSSLQVAAYTWLRKPRWMLVMRQDYAEAFQDVNRTNLVMLVFFHTSALIILVIAILVTRHMISTIKGRDQEVEEANRKFLEASKLASVGGLSSGVAHEINNPLAIILSEVQLLEDTSQHTEVSSATRESQLVDSMSRIRKQVKRCKRLTHSLLRYSRHDDPTVTEASLADLAREVIDLVEGDATARGLTISLEQEAGLPNIATDSSQLQQVILNLLSNAMDAHDGRYSGSIRLRIQRSVGHAGVDITVTDTGCGIPEAIVRKVFDPFFTTKSRGKGTGLGLAICHGIVKRLGGDISVVSQQGLGTTFTVSLPWRPPDDVVEGIADAGTPTRRAG